MWENDGTLNGHNINNSEKNDNDDLEAYNGFVRILSIAIVTRMEHI